MGLVGDMVTEEALPSYMNMLNLLDAAKVKQVDIRDGSANAAS